NTPIQYVGGNLDFLESAVARMMSLLTAGRERAREGGAEACGRMVLEAFETGDLAFVLDELPPALADIREGVERVTSIVQSMKRFAHPEREAMTMVDLNAAIRNTVNVARNEWKYVAEVEMDLDPDLPPVLCSAGDFNQVVLNLLINAAHAIGDVVAGTGSKGVVTIATKQRGEWVEISVKDTGFGIPKAIQDRIYDPFFTTKEAGKGTGQGLTIVYSIIQKHGAKIRFTTRQGKGTTFFVEFPLGEEARP
ncbi:MAG: HAMP domain-containing histidine kinase, partial [Deltaproteobacteria bacterium]|nr:HAMP domain-containing histidine kinase [Deltaproteobacteria bacterium]